MSEAYHRAWRDSIDNREAFWLAAAEGIDWIKTPQAAYAEDRGWFPGGTLNTAYNCVDRHVAAGRGGNVALAYDSPVTDTVRRYTYNELRRLTKHKTIKISKIELVRTPIFPILQNTAV